MAKLRLKKNDVVKVIAGKNKGMSGKIVAVDAAKRKVMVAGVNMVVKTVKRKSQQEQGGFVNIEAPLDISNVQIVSKGNISRIGYKDSAGKKKRIAKKTGEEL